MGTITIKIPQDIFREYELDNVAVTELLLSRLQALQPEAMLFAPDSLSGLFADEAELLEAVTEAAMQARERDPLRVTHG